MKYVVITGGASGMGRATALKLAQNGYHIFSCDIKKNTEEVDNITQLIVDVPDTRILGTIYDFFRINLRKFRAVKIY